MAAANRDDLATVTFANEMSSRTVNELAIRAQGGCAVAFAELYRRFFPRLVRFLERRLAHSPVDAEDVSQEALAKAWQSIAGFDARFQFTTWLYTIARRTAVDHLRHSRGTPQSARLDDLPTKERSVEMQAERLEMADNLWATAQRLLTEAQYSALWLKYGEELSVKEIAMVLGKSTVGVRVLLHRSRAALRPYLSDADRESGLRAGVPNDQGELK